MSLDNSRVAICVCVCVCVCVCTYMITCIYENVCEYAVNAVLICPLTSRGLLCVYICLCTYEYMLYMCM